MADYERNNVSDAQMGWMIGFFAMGTLVGAIAALMLATQSGAETRADIRQGFDDVKLKLGELSEQAVSKGKVLAEKGREILEEKKTVVKSALEAGREASKKTREDASQELATTE